MRERIEPIGSQRFGARLQRGGVIRVTPTTNLDNDVVNPSRRGVRHEVVDRSFGGDLVADHPERFIPPGGRGPRWGRGPRARAASMFSGRDSAGIVQPPAASHRRPAVCATPSRASRFAIALVFATKASSENPPIAPREGTAARNAARSGFPASRGFHETAATG